MISISPRGGASRYTPNPSRPFLVITLEVISITGLLLSSNQCLLAYGTSIATPKESDLMKLDYQLQSTIERVQYPLNVPTA